MLYEKNYLAKNGLADGHACMEFPERLHDSWIPRLTIIPHRVFSLRLVTAVAFFLPMKKNRERNQGQST